MASHVGWDIYPHLTPIPTRCNPLEIFSSLPTTFWDEPTALSNPDAWPVSGSSPPVEFLVSLENFQKIQPCASLHLISDLWYCPNFIFQDVGSTRVSVSFYVHFLREFGRCNFSIILHFLFEIIIVKIAFQVVESYSPNVKNRLRLYEDRFLYKIVQDHKIL